MKSSAPDITIGDLAARFGLATHVLRHWETMGLLAPARVAGGQRRYTPADLERVAIILMCKEAGLGLREMRDLLASSNPMDREDLLRRHVTELDNRIAQAQAAKDLIEHAMACPLPFETCPHARVRIASRIPASAE